MVTTASGRKIDYTVTGTFKDNSDFIGDFAASDVNAAAYGESRNTTNVFIKLDQGANADAVRAQIEGRLKGFPTATCRTSRSSRTRSPSSSTHCWA